ncbi:MAG: YraN family protein [Rhodospirillaceae bacterium]|nr:YraN family protein [Rhodospirillaceae bacterium]
MSGRVTERRRAADRRGRTAEERAAALLEAQGYTILARRYRVRGGEVDLIAADPDGVVAFVEVKARAVGADALAAVGARQRARIVTGALTYVAETPERAASPLRFDVVAVDGTGALHHLADAWRPEGDHGAF